MSQLCRNGNIHVSTRRTRLESSQAKLFALVRTSFESDTNEEFARATQETGWRGIGGGNYEQYQTKKKNVYQYTKSNTGYVWKGSNVGTQCCHSPSFSLLLKRVCSQSSTHILDQQPEKHQQLLLALLRTSYNTGRKRWK